MCFVVLFCVLFWSICLLFVAVCRSCRNCCFDILSLSLYRVSSHTCTRPRSYSDKSIFRVTIPATSGDMGVVGKLQNHNRYCVTPQPFLVTPELLLCNTIIVMFSLELWVMSMSWAYHPCCADVLVLGQTCACAIAHLIPAQLTFAVHHVCPPHTQPPWPPP
jgi:hypothetical protein